MQRARMMHRGTGKRKPWTHGPSGGARRSAVCLTVAVLMVAHGLASPALYAQTMPNAENGLIPSSAARMPIGLLLPLSGRNRLLGERVLRGALLAANVLPPAPGKIDLLVRDTQSNPQQAARVLEELAAMGVAAAISSPEKQEAQGAAARAEALGIPFIELAPDETAGGPLAFKLVRPNVARAELLARQVVARGRTKPVVLYPETPYGRLMAEAFEEALRSRGIHLAGKISFDEKATTFINLAKRLLALKPDAVFIPATAVQLELVAAQLYASGLFNVSAPLPAKHAAKRAPLAPAVAAKHAPLLLATADGIAARFLSAAGRYTQGAILAPVFYPDENDAAIGGFVARFREQFSDDPTAAEALAYDAVRVVKVALESAPNLTSVGDRRALIVEYLRASALEGLTGALGFNARGERKGESQLYSVEGETIRAFR